MGEKKEPNEGTVPCLVCMNRFDYLTPGHLSSSKCKSGNPSDIDSYRTWVADEYEINQDDRIFTKNQIQKPQYYRKHAKRLDLPK